ncbi:hypothetical protein [Sorangium sp. So ce131]|uniref:hypothetical protein n=1 Tax=Sorangium sp. So ce131 TaxID=3133282 RepID=UPI003F5ED293
MKGSTHIVMCVLLCSSLAACTNETRGGGQGEDSGGAGGEGTASGAGGVGGEAAAGGGGVGGEAAAGGGAAGGGAAGGGGATDSELAISAVPAALRFVAMARGAAPPVQTVEATFNGAQVSVAEAPPWLTVTPPSDPAVSPARFGVAVAGTEFPAGTELSGDVVFRTSRPGSSLERSFGVHVDYAVVEPFVLPHVRFVAPYIGTAGRPGRLIARGVNFNAPGTTLTVVLGTTEIGPLVPESDTQLTFNYPALPEGRYPVSIKNPAEITSTDAELVVLAPTEMRYQALSAPSPRRRLVYDAERQTLYAVNRLDQQIERYRFAEGTWTVEAPYTLPELTDLDLATNGRSLIATTKDAVNDIPLGVSPFRATARAGLPDPHCGAYLDQVHASNDGHLLIMSQYAMCSGFSPAYLYDMLASSPRTSLSGAGSFFMGLAGASADGSRIYVGGNGLSPPENVQIFNSLTNTFSYGPPAHSLVAVSVSGDASRVILQRYIVYSRALSLTGNLPGGVALASRDSSRAFAYRDNGGRPRLVVYDLNAEVTGDAQYPELSTIDLPDSPISPEGRRDAISMAATPDDRVVFVSGDRKLLVVPVE